MEDAKGTDDALRRERESVLRTEMKHGFSEDPFAHEKLTLGRMADGLLTFGCWIAAVLSLEVMFWIVVLGLGVGLWGIR